MSKVTGEQAYRQKLLSGLLEGPSASKVVNQLLVKRLIMFLYNIAKVPGNPHLHEVFTSCLKGYEEIWLTEILKIELVEFSEVTNKVMLQLDEEDVRHFDKLMAALDALKEDMCDHKTHKNIRPGLLTLLGYLDKILKGLPKYTRQNLDLSVIKIDSKILMESLSTELKILTLDEFAKMHGSKVSEATNETTNVCTSVEQLKPRNFDVLLDKAEKESRNEWVQKKKENELAQYFNKINEGSELNDAGDSVNRDGSNNKKSREKKQPEDTTRKDSNQEQRQNEYKQLQDIYKSNGNYSSY